MPVVHVRIKWYIDICANNFRPNKLIRMKRFIQLVILIFLLQGFTACNHYRSIKTAHKVASLSGNPFYHTLSKSMMKNIYGFMKGQSQKKSIGKVHLETTLKTFLINREQWDAFKSKIGNFYQIGDSPLEQQFSTINTVRDLIMFTAKYGTKFPPCY